MAQHLLNDLDAGRPPKASPILRKPGALAAQGCWPCPGKLKQAVL